MAIYSSLFLAITLVTVFQYFQICSRHHFSTIGFHFHQIGNTRLRADIGKISGISFDAQDQFGFVDIHPLQISRTQDIALHILVFGGIRLNFTNMRVGLKLLSLKTPGCTAVSGTTKP
jgi:hypothetical protein